MGVTEPTPAPPGPKPVPSPPPLPKNETTTKGKLPPTHLRPIKSSLMPRLRPGLREDGTAADQGCDKGETMTETNFICTGCAANMQDGSRAYGGSFCYSCVCQRLCEKVLKWRLLDGEHWIDVEGRGQTAPPDFEHNLAAAMGLATAAGKRFNTKFVIRFDPPDTGDRTLYNVDYFPPHPAQSSGASCWSPAQSLTRAVWRLVNDKAVDDG